MFEKNLAPYRQSLATRLIAAMLLPTLAVTTLLCLHATSYVEDHFTTELEEKGQAIALALSASVAGSKDESPGKLHAALPGYLDKTRSLSGIAYIHVHDAQGRTLLATTTPRFLGPSPDTCWLNLRELSKGQKVKIRRDLQADLPGKRLSVIDVAAPSAEGTVVHVGLDRSLIAEKVRGIRFGLLLFAFTMCVLGLVFSVWVVYSLVLRPIRSLTRAVWGVVDSGDLGIEIRVRSADEVGRLSQGVRRMIERLRAVPERLRDSVHSLGEIRAQLGQTVPVSAQRIVNRVYEAESSLSGITTSLDGLSRHVGELHQSTDGASKLMEAVATNNQALTGSVQSMADSVARAALAMEEMGRSVQGVAENIQEVHQSTAWVSQFIREMDRNLQKVQQNSSAATEISTQLTHDAETCLQAMQKTISGIEQIRASAGLAAEVIRSLGSRITQIGEMVGLIEGIAHQTNFLALNATIIAAQAGDQGLGFAVIASEIKGLAERVGISTREIAELMGHIERESHNAVRAVERGLGDVEQGARLGRETEVALRKIVSSATQAGQNVAAIAAATVEQTQGSASMTATIHLIATKMQDVREYAAQQAKQAERVMRGTHEMKGFTQRVQESSQEQAQRWEELSKSFENIHTMLELMTRSQRDRAQGSEQVQQAIRAIHSVSEQQTDLVREFDQALMLLNRQAETLITEMTRFRV